MLRSRDRLRHVGKQRETEKESSLSFYSFHTISVHRAHSETIPEMDRKTMEATMIAMVF